jgi:two-component sensor histidine kinase
MQDPHNTTRLNGESSTSSGSPRPDDSSELGRLIRERDWAQSSLGSVECWPAPLRIVTDLVLAAPYPAALWWDRDLTLIYNDAFSFIIGERHPDALGCPARLAWPEQAAGIAAIASKVLSDGCSCIDEHARLHLAQASKNDDGPLTFSYVPVRDCNSAIRGILVESRFTLPSAGRTMVSAAESQRQVRNVLAVVRSVARRTGATSGSVEDFAAHFDGRIGAFARTQAMLGRSPRQSIDLETIIRDELVEQVADSDQISLEGPELLLTGKLAEVMTLAIHELATNATKFGAFALRGSRLSICWSAQNAAGARHLRLEWSESGVPLTGAGSERQGYGTELIERMIPYELNGKSKLEFRSGGVRCVIEVPL